MFSMRNAERFLIKKNYDVPEGVTVQEIPFYSRSDSQSPGSSAAAGKVSGVE